MWRTLRNLRKSMLQTKDEQNIGEVKDFYFDDQEWTVRYLVVDTGNWLNEKLVLISPHAIKEISVGGFVLTTDLSRTQIEQAPLAESHKPLDRLLEEKYARYYGWPLYWTVGTDIFPAEVPQSTISRAEDKSLERKIRNSHLRSYSDILSYTIHARDDQFGHVEDLVVNEHFEITHLIIDTVNFWPSKSVVIPHTFIEEINWADREVKTDLTREEIETCREYNPYDFIQKSPNDQHLPPG